MYNEASGELSLRGYDKDDPLETIRLDNYRLELSSARDWLFGPTESDGDWGERFLALRVRFSFANAASFYRKIDSLRACVAAAVPQNAGAFGDESDGQSAVPRTAALWFPIRR
jgi:hypothetical protein